MRGPRPLDFSHEPRKTSSKGELLDHLPAGLLLNHFADFEVLQFDQLLYTISDDPAAALVVPFSGTDVIPAKPDQASIPADMIRQYPSLVAFS